MEGFVEESISWQIRVNREMRGMTQSKLAEILGTGQPAISRLENADSTGFQIGTLISLANAFKCALEVRFVPYSRLLTLTKDTSPKVLFAEPYDSESQKTIGVSSGS